MKLCIHSTIQVNIIFWSLQSAATAAESISFGRELMGIFVPLLLVIALLVGTLLILQRRFKVGKTDGPLHVVQVLPIGPKERIVVLQQAGRKFAVGVAPGTVQFIADLQEIDDDDDSVTEVRQPNPLSTN